MYYVHNIRVASTAETQTDAETTTDTEGVCTAAFLCGRLFQHVCFFCRKRFPDAGFRVAGLGLAFRSGVWA